MIDIIVLMINVYITFRRQKIIPIVQTLAEPLGIVTGSSSSPLSMAVTPGFVDNSIDTHGLLELGFHMMSV
jgi:hypothetical protein